MNWNQAIGMIAAGHDVEHALDIKGAADRSAFRAFMLKEAETNPRAGPALEHYDQAMRDMDSGVMGARGTWHALSEAQRRVLAEIAKSATGKVIRDASGRSYTLHFYPFGYGRIGGAPTIRALCSRDLMAWDGGAFDPEAAAVITERGRFVLAHGQPTPETSPRTDHASCPPPSEDNPPR